MLVDTNHQKQQWQTALYCAVEYNYFDFGTWLADAQNGAGADDILKNMNDRSPYDGLG